MITLLDRSAAGRAEGAADRAEPWTLVEGGFGTTVAAPSGPVAGAELLDDGNGVRVQFSAGDVAGFTGRWVHRRAGGRVGAALDQWTTRAGDRP